MTTSWDTASRPTATPYNNRVKPGDFTYYTWDTWLDTWDEATYTWDEIGTGISPVEWDPRVILSGTTISNSMPIIVTGFWDDTHLWSDSLYWHDGGNYVGATEYTTRIIP